MSIIHERAEMADAWNQRQGPLNINELSALARFCAAWPAPIPAIRFIRQAKDTSPGNELIGQCELEERGWLRVRNRGHFSAPMVIEVTGRALREFPALGFPTGRASLIAEAAMKSTLATAIVAVCPPRMTPAQIIAACAAVVVDPKDSPADRRVLALSGDLMAAAADGGFTDEPELLRATASGDSAHAAQITGLAAECIDPDEFARILDEFGMAGLIASAH
jgi:hypothetical protein